MKLTFWKQADQVNEFGETIYKTDDQLEGSWLDRPIFGGGTTESPPETWYRVIARSAGVLAVLLVPIFFLPWTTNILDLNKEILLISIVGLGFIFWLLGIVSSGWLNWRSNPFEKVFLVMAVVSLITTILAISPFRSLFGTNASLSESFVAMIIFFLLFLLIAQTAPNRGPAIRDALASSAVIAYIVALLQIFGIFLFPFPFSESKAFNTVGTLHAVGLLAAGLLPFFGMYRPSWSWLKFLMIDKIGVVLGLLLLFILNWFILWIVAIAGMVGLIISEGLSGERFRISRLLYPMTLIVISVFLILISINPIPWISGLPIEVGPSHNLSSDLVLSVMGDRLVIGYGAENFSLAFDRYGASQIANTQLGSSKFYDASSSFMNYLIHHGILGLASLVFLLSVIGWTIKKFKTYLSFEQDADIRKEDMGLLAAFIAFTIGWFLYPYHFTLMFVWYVLLSLVVVTIWGSNQRYYNIEERTSLSLVSSLGFIGGLILVLVGAYFVGTIYLADLKYAQALVGNNNENSAAKVIEAINLNNQDGRFYRTASQTAISLLSQEISAPQSPERTARIQNYTSSAVTLAKRATETEPEESLNWANLGNIYQNLLTLVEGADRLAEEAHLKAAELRPGDAIFYNQIGQTYLSEYEVLRRIAANSRNADISRLGAQAQVALTKAEENFKKAIELSSNFGTAIYSLGAVYDRQGKVNEAIRELERVLPANRNQPGLRFELGLLYYRSGNKSKALEQLQQAVVLAPDYSNARWYIALLLEEQNDVKGAIDQLERIQAIDSNRDNQVVIQKLEQLRSGTRTIPPGNVLDQRPIN